LRVSSSGLNGLPTNETSAPRWFFENAARGPIELQEVEVHVPRHGGQLPDREVDRGAEELGKPPAREVLGAALPASEAEEAGRMVLCENARALYAA